MSDVSIPSPSEPQISPTVRESEPTTTQIKAVAPQRGDACASCGTAMASDQRYCLECGQRRGDPRLPFMDAVVLMDAVKQPSPPPPPPTKEKRRGISPNAALIAGIGTLLLALGIGVLIGRSGHQEVAQTSPAPIVIHSGDGETATASKSNTTTGGGAASKAKTKKQKQAALEEAESHPAAEEIIKPANGVKLAPPTVKPGDKCEKGAAGCENGEFTGNFFGE